MLRKKVKKNNVDNENSKILISDPFLIIKSGNIENVIKMLNNNQINVNYSRWSGVSLLHRAAQLGLTDICEILLIKGASVNSKTYKGYYTPLHLALYNGYVDTAQLLLKYNANPWSLSKYNENCFDYGIKNNHKKLCEEFRSVIVKKEMMLTIKKHQNNILNNINNKNDLNANTIATDII